MSQLVVRNVADAARGPAIVEHFAIEGLFGYRSVSFSSSNAATVLIARNGSGKTTLIAALDAFLRGQFSRFATVAFTKIYCRLRGLDFWLEVSKEMIDSLIDFSSQTELLLSAKTWDVQPFALLELLETVRGAKIDELHENPTFHAIYSKTGFDTQVTRFQCEKLAAALDDRVPQLAKIRNTIRKVLGNTEIVYLPTYRRIELSIPQPDQPKYMGRKRNMLSRLGIARSGLYTADIQFGLGDISDRLKALYSEMLSISNQGYGKVSANIINDLISGGYKNSSADPSLLPTKEALELFFNRIKQAERSYGRTPFRNFILSPDLNRVYSGDVPQDAAPFLNYFLEQLNSIIQQTRGTEELVEAFIGSCNNYLSNEDFSTDNFAAFDNKRLTFNRRNFKVKVISLATKSEVPLESLSSGEKQMISLFARLYLYPGPKIILIDEPELSLSLDWQRQILLDVLRAPSCQQTIAITHSPFIFDNELEAYAGALQVKIDPPEASLFSDTGFDEDLEGDEE
ncbi:AAA family ATPase [Variovorax sp. 278MFTsu5.1]|uniref:AAA family ATPase n=1 Tax=Variovorax sp. 278MFTsu5.1 TaxID=3158366 RepID=UPI003AAD5859